MKKKAFRLESEFIELIKLLKVLHIASTGGHAKQMVDEGNVSLNGKPEYRKRAKLRTGDVVTVTGIEITIGA
jgi:ribosome-associated protein